jgi:hypothetical protein
MHFTPKHGSWLNIAEVELNVMTKQCLSRRVESINKLKTELLAGKVKGIMTHQKSIGISQIITHVQS